MSLALLLGSLGGGPDGGGPPPTPVPEHGPMHADVVDGDILPLGMLGTSEYHYIQQDTE